ncbi:MAG: hypothetical protein QOH31_3919 [Verrucomicrobiota bacterium]
MNILTSNSGDDRRPLVGSPQQDRRLVLTDRRFLGKSHNYFSTWKDGSTSELIMTFGDSLLQALGTGLCERSVPPIHSRRSRLCGPAASFSCFGPLAPQFGQVPSNCFLLTDWIFPRAFRQKGHSVYLSLFSGSRTVVQRVPQKLWEFPIVSCPQSVCGGITLIVPLSSGTKKKPK